jgi:prepilin-type N-terminal cleavage/methylation domain-containing protein
MTGWIGKRLRDERGFTIVECLVAAIILAIGSMAVFTTFVSAIHNVQRSRESQFGISIAQREMEWVRAHSFSEIGIKEASLPAPPASPKASEERTNPLLRVTGSRTEFSAIRSETIVNTTTFKKKMAAVDGLSNGFKLSKEAKFLEGSGSNKQAQATVYRFVLCEETGVLASNCQAKRIIIDVVPKLQFNAKTDYQRSYYELQSTVLNPAVRQ